MENRFDKKQSIKYYTTYWSKEAQRHSSEIDYIQGFSQ